MSKGFRKSLFGFNTEDVLKYISASDNAAKTKISKLEKELCEKASEIEKLKAVAEEYNSKKEYLELMTENTARIYLAAKSTSKLMIDNADESRRLIEEANASHLDSINSVQDAMSEIKDKINTACKSYCDEVENLGTALDELKNRISENKSESDSAINQFNALVNKNV